MKKKLKTILIVILAMTGFTSCNDDGCGMDSVPVKTVVLEDAITQEAISFAESIKGGAIDLCNIDLSV